MNDNTFEIEKALQTREAFVSFMARCWPGLDIAFSLTRDYIENGDAARYQLPATPADFAEDAEARAALLMRIARVLECSAKIVRASDCNVVRLVETDTPARPDSQ